MSSILILGYLRVKLISKDIKNIRVVIRAVLILSVFVGVRRKLFILFNMI